MLDLPKGAGAVPAIRRQALTRFLTRVKNAAGVQGELTVLLAGDGRLRALNRQFRGKNKATDVLSFPADPLSGVAGDLAISVQTAERQAVELGHPLDTELRILILHGVLHLAGLDHEVDDGEMAARETALRARFRLPAGLIERTQPASVPRRTPATRSTARR